MKTPKLLTPLSINRYVLKNTKKNIYNQHSVIFTDNVQDTFNQNVSTNMRGFLIGTGWMVEVNYLLDIKKDTIAINN
jgi:hypothetical protein